MLVANLIFEFGVTMCVYLIFFNHGGHGVSRRKTRDSYQKLLIPPCYSVVFILKYTRMVS